MKNINMLYCVGTMNSIKNQVEELVFSELIYIEEVVKANEVKFSFA